MTKSFESNSNSNESIADNSLVSSFSTSLSISVSVSASASKSISNSASSASAASIKSSEASKYSKLSAWRSSTAKEASDNLAKSSSSNSSSSSDDDLGLGNLDNADFLVGLGNLSKDMPSNSSESSSEASAVKSYDASVKASKASLSAHIKAVGAEDSYSDNRYYDVHDDKWGTADWIFYSNTGLLNVNFGKISNRPLTNILSRDEVNQVKSITFDNVTAPINCSHLLSHFPNVTRIDLSNLNMSNTTNICDLFSEDVSLHEVNLTSLNTNRINDMYGMFYGDDQIKLLKLGTDTILDDTIEGHINDDYWYEASTGYEGFLNSFNITEPQIFINDGAPEKTNPKDLTSSLIGNYFINNNKSLANFAQRFKSPVINGNIINPVLCTKLQDIKNKLKVYNKCFIDFYVTYRFNKEFKEWCYENDSEPHNAKGYSKWRTTNDYSRCFDNILTNLSEHAKAIMTPEKILHMVNKNEYNLDSNYNHITRNEEKLLKYLIKHNINAKDALVDVKDEPKFKYITTHDDDKAASLKIELKNKISLRNKLQFLHEYFDSNVKVSQLLEHADTPDDLTKRQFLRKMRYDHDLIKKYNIFYNEHKFVGEFRTSQYRYYYYEEMVKALKQGVLPKSMLTSNYVNKFANQIREELNSNNVMFCSKYVLSKKLDKGLASGNPVKALLNNCAVLKEIHEDN